MSIFHSWVSSYLLWTPCMCHCVYGVVHDYVWPTLGLYSDNIMALYSYHLDFLLIRHFSCNVMTLFL